MYDVDHRYGFGEVTGSGFPGESPGLLPIAKSWGPVEQATISYGYGLNVTPLQLANAYTSIANNGRSRSPTFVKGAQNPDTAVIDPEIATSIRRMLETVVAPGGTAYPQAVVPNYLVAGKTGTARSASGGGYENRYVSLFVGMVPASNPRLVGVVIIHDPQGALYYGGYVSAPVFSKVMSGALRLLDVPPDNVKNWYTGSPQGGPTIDAKAPPSDESPEVATYAEGVPP
jgi:cell division protein FtsI (penicillin-binding protein 3)